MLREGPSLEGGAGGLAAGPLTTGAHSWAPRHFPCPGRFGRSRDKLTGQSGRAMTLGALLLLLGVLEAPLAPGKSVWTPEEAMTGTMVAASHRSVT